ncbi:MAG: peptidyl-prolyl cis-trans isomerase [Deltaproteobacteria bacterium]|nr:MAG: peptidyl-prolyl cis-trans isomerase [Deltaproteobacteria bacterium]
MDAQASQSRSTVLWLAFFAAAGLALAATGLLQRRSASALPSGAIARVNGSVIDAESYERLIVALASDRRGELTDADRRRVLDRMIEEELLVQRALELGLARVDRRVRADLVSAVIASVTADAERRTPTDADLRALYDAEPEFFARPGRLRVRQIFFRVRSPDDVDAASARAEAATRRLAAGEAFEEVARALGDEPIVPIPDAPLPATKLQEYLGPSATRVALASDGSSPSAPVRSGTGFHILDVREREPRVIPPFDAIRDRLRAEWTRREGERALRAYLDELRARADLVVAPGVP